ncbi:MAG TPA: fimbria/pilus outer membrane usher protein [Rhodanobacteraceae bacterium]
MAIALALAGMLAPTSHARAAVAIAPASAAAAKADAAVSPADASADASYAPADANANIEFNTSMLAGHSSRTIDLTRFEKGVDVLPGMYNVDVYLNGQWIGRMDVRFATPKPGTNAQPCFTDTLVKRLQLTAQVAAGKAGAQVAACPQLDDLVAGARATFDMSALRLNITVPQALMGDQPRGYVDPSAWDAGIPAFLLNYRFNAYHNENAGLGQTNAYLGLQAGLNIGKWQLRENGTLTWQSAAGGMTARRQWHTIDAYVQRAIPALKAELTIGDSHSDGAVFDSVAFRGVQLSTDDRMYPQSRRGYAPVIRGVAQTNAKVTVYQNGIQIYQTTVPPGAFVIDDLYPSGYGGSLRVTVTEADGRQRSWDVPYASVSQLVRAGVTRFNLSAGQLRNQPLDSNARFIEGAIQHGFNNTFTGYAGFQGSNGYAAALIGGAFNTRFGALAMDLTEAGVTLPGQMAHTGQSVRMTWSKRLPSTHTSFSLAAYRYSTSGFLSLADAATARAYASRGMDTFAEQDTSVPTIDGVPVPGVLTPAQRAALSGQQAEVQFAPQNLLHQRNRFTLSMNQQLGQDGGAAFANVSFHDYWNQSSRDTTFQLGYNNHIGPLSYGISASRTRDITGRFDNMVYASFSLPLGRSTHAPTLMVNLQHDDEGGSQQQAMLNGSAGRYGQFNYGATASHASDGGNAASINAGYRGSDAVLNASYGKGDGYSQASFGASGSLLAHAGGITFGQPTGDTVALIHAPKAAGAVVQSSPGVHLNRHGYAIVPYLTPYQLDTVRLDPAKLPLGVQLDATSASVAPYAGAMVAMNFKTHYGRALIARITLPDGKLAPFGAEVLDVQGNTVGTVGQGGMALLRVHTRTGQLHIQRAAASNRTQTCRFDYRLASAEGSHKLARINAICTAP